MAMFDVERITYLLRVSRLMAEGQRSVADLVKEASKAVEVARIDDIGCVRGHQNLQCISADATSV